LIARRAEAKVMILRPFVFASYLLIFVGVNVVRVLTVAAPSSKAAPALLRRDTSFTEDDNKQQSAQADRISCGGHTAINCADCPDWGGYNTDHGAKWCNGDCQWDQDISKCIWRGPKPQELTGLKNPNFTAYDRQVIAHAADAGVRQKAIEADERLRLQHEEEARASDVGLTRKLHIFVCWSVGSGVCAVLTAFGSLAYFLFGKPKVKGKYVPPKRKAQDEYTVVIKKTLGAKLGLDITLKADAMLINKVTGGLALAWNEQFPKLQIKAGDEVVEVNGVKGEGGKGKKLLEECAKNKELVLRLVRYMKEEDTVHGAQEEDTVQGAQEGQDDKESSDADEKDAPASTIAKDEAPEF